MNLPDALDRLVIRIRAGDLPAARELYDLCEPHVERAIRRRRRQLWHTQLETLLDTVDVSQDVRSRFFDLIRNREFQPKDGMEAVRMLMVLTRRAVGLQSRHHHRACRDIARTVPLDAGADPADSRPGPDQLAATAELLDGATAQLSVREREILRRRSEGSAWSELAADSGTTSDALRKQIERRVCQIRSALDRSQKSPIDRPQSRRDTQNAPDPRTPENGPAARPGGIAPADD